MISEMMNSSIPSVGASTREERLASGGPWCSSCSAWPVACAAALHRGRLRADVGLDVLDRHVGGVADALDELVGDPLGRALGQRRDDDLRDVEVLHGVHHRRVGVGVADHARGHDAGVVQRRRAAGAGARAPRATAWPSVLACGTTTMNRCGPSAASAFRRSTSSGARHGQVGDHERDVERQALAARSTTTCSTGSARGLLEALDQVAPEPAGGRAPGSVETMISSIPRSAHRVHRGVERVRSPTSPCGDALVAHELQREVDADLRGVAHDLVVDHVAVARPGLRHDDEEARRRPPCARSPGRARAACPRRSSRWRGRGWLRHAYASSS